MRIVLIQNQDSVSLCIWPQYVYPVPKPELWLANHREAQKNCPMRGAGWANLEVMTGNKPWCP